MRCRQRKGPIAGMARSYTGEKGDFRVKVYFTLAIMAPGATLTFMVPEPAPRMMKNFPVGAGLPAIAAPAAEQTPIRGQGRSYRKPGIFLLFHANFHDARSPPDDKTAPRLRAGAK